jgi:hypothetical protein
MKKQNLDQDGHVIMFFELFFVIMVNHKLPCSYSLSWITVEKHARCICEWNTCASKICVRGLWANNPSSFYMSIYMFYYLHEFILVEFAKKEKSFCYNILT